MLKKSVTYTDYNDVEQTENFYFHLTKAEVLDFSLDGEEGFIEQIKRINKSSTPREIIDTFKSIILKAYGIKSEDGKSFRKSATISEEFSQTEAYSTLFFELVTNAEDAGEFVKGLLPKGLPSEADLMAKPQDHLTKTIDPSSVTVVSSPTNEDKRAQYESWLAQQEASDRDKLDQ